MMDLGGGTTTTVVIEITATRAASIHKAKTEKGLIDKVKTDKFKPDRVKINEAPFDRVPLASRCEPVVSFKIGSVQLCTTITALSTEQDVAHPACLENTMAACLRAKFATTAWASAWPRP
jgi:hypothetical protein